MSMEQTQKYCMKCRSKELHARPGTNHILHLLITLLLCGFWIPIWIISSLKIGGWRCQKCGTAVHRVPVFLLSFALIVCGLLYGCSQFAKYTSSKQDKKPRPIETTQAAPPITALKENPARTAIPNTVAPIQPAAPTRPTEPAIPEVRDLITLEGISLPVVLEVIAPFKLMDAAGKETLIPVDTSVLVEKRSPGGTLTMKIGGKTFVGNESRLAKMVRIAPK